VQDFRAALPGARICVFDNNSEDRTADLAREAGAEVFRSPRQGKGNVVRHMFDVVDAEYCVLVDGDDTYPAAAAPELVALAVRSGADMVVGQRLEAHDRASFRRFHRFGNHVISRLIARIFGLKVKDVLSGYRVLSREFVRTIPLSSPGFEIETELTLQAAAKRFTMVEHPIKYGERPAGSHSKLSTFGDGFLILRMIFGILMHHRPLMFFGGMGACAILLSLLAGIAPVRDYVEHRWVYHVPLAILAAALFTVGTLSVGMGLLLKTIRGYHDENFELWRRMAHHLDTRAGDQSPHRPR